MPKVLVADDSITVRKVAERLLTEAGLEVALAASGEEAVTWLEKERPDFIISDVIMPDKSGYEVCRFVRAHASLSGTPVLLISGVVNEEVTRQAQSCRADGVLKKPFQGTSLKDRVLELLAKRRQELHTAATVYGTADVAAPPPSKPAGVSEAGPVRAYRITEQQLETFRRASARIHELEALLAEERARPAGPAGVPAPVVELEAAVAAERQRSAEWQERWEAAQRQIAELQAGVLETGAVPPGADRMTELERMLREQEALTTSLTEEVEASRHWRTRVRELEESVAEERARVQEVTLRLHNVSEAGAQLETLEQDLELARTELARERRRIADLEAARQADQERTETALQQASALQETQQRLADTEQQLADEHARLVQVESALEAVGGREQEAARTIAAQSSRLTELEARLDQAERSLAQEHNRAARLTEQVKQGEQWRVQAEETQRLLAEEQEKASQLADEVPRLEARVAEMEALLADQRERATKLVHEVTRLRQADARIQLLERALQDEQTKAGETAQRLASLEKTATQANARVEEITQVLTQIASLSGHAGQPPGRA